MFSVLVLAVDNESMNYVYRGNGIARNYTDNCTLVSEDDPHVCEDDEIEVFCPFALYLPESGLYQCRTSPGSYLIVKNGTNSPDLLKTACPKG